MNSLRRLLPVLLCWLAAAAQAGDVADVAYVSDQEQGVLRIDLAAPHAPPQVLAMPGSGPRGIALSDDGRWLLTANLKTQDLAVIDTQSMSIVRRIPVGKNAEFLRVLGSRAYVTYEPASQGGAPAQNPKKGAGGDEDDKTPSQIAVLDFAQGRLIRSMPGAPETEGIEFSADGRWLVVANEGDDTLSVYALASGEKIRTVALRAHGQRPRGIKISPDGKRYAVTLENSNKLLLLDERLQVLRTVDTAAGPYGVAFDRAGGRLVVAASRGRRLQVFDSASLALLADIPVGERCWHFSFTPDEAQLLLACGRSHSLLRIDMQTYKLQDEIGNLAMPWGVITWPRSNGSLDAPLRPQP